MPMTRWSMMTPKMQAPTSQTVEETPSTGNVVPEVPVIENPPTAAEVVGEPAAEQFDIPTDAPPPAEQSPPAAAPPDGRVDTV